MLLHVQLLYPCWVSNTAGSIQLKNEPHHLFSRCSNSKHNLLHFWGLTPIVHMFCPASQCADAEHLHPAYAFSTVNNIWNAASHLPRERAWCKVTLLDCFPFLLSSSFLSLHGLLYGQIPPFCWATWQNQALEKKKMLSMTSQTRMCKTSIKCCISDLIKSHPCLYVNNYLQCKAVCCLHSYTSC